jgi:hypothetical protein
MSTMIFLTAFAALLMRLGAHIVQRERVRVRIARRIDRIAREG